MFASLDLSGPAMPEHREKAVCMAGKIGARLVVELLCIEMSARREGKGHREHQRQEGRGGREARLERREDDQRDRGLRPPLSRASQDKERPRAPARQRQPGAPPAGVRRRVRDLRHGASELRLVLSGLRRLGLGPKRHRKRHRPLRAQVWPGCRGRLIGPHNAPARHRRADEGAPVRRHVALLAIRMRQKHAVP